MGNDQTQAVTAMIRFHYYAQTRLEFAAAVRFNLSTLALADHEACWL